MAAKNSRLGVLHEMVTEVMIQVVQGTEITVDVEDPVTGEAKQEKRVIPPSAAELQAITKFLKDNDVTGIADEGTTMGVLKDKFKRMAEDAEKRRQAQVGQLDSDDYKFLEGLRDQ